MRRAMSPATCTQVTSVPSGVRSRSALRSFSSDALSRAALTKAPGKYQRSFTTQSTGERFECTLNTFMNTLTLRASRIAGDLARRIAEELQDEQREQPERHRPPPSGEKTY